MCPEDFYWLYAGEARPGEPELDFRVRIITESLQELLRFGLPGLQPGESLVFQISYGGEGPAPYEVFAVTLAGGIRNVLELEE